MGICHESIRQRCSKTLDHSIYLGFGWQYPEKDETINEDEIEGKHKSWEELRDLQWLGGACCPMANTQEEQQQRYVSGERSFVQPQTQQQRQVWDQFVRHNQLEIEQKELHQKQIKEQQQHHLPPRLLQEMLDCKEDTPFKIKFAEAVKSYETYKIKGRNYLIAFERCVSTAVVAFNDATVKKGESQSIKATKAIWVIIKDAIIASVASACAKC